MIFCTVNYQIKHLEIFNKLGSKTLITETSGSKRAENITIKENVLRLPEIYVITPTYEHWSEKAELIRVWQAFRLSGVRILWLLVEDRDSGDGNDQSKNSDKIVKFSAEVEAESDNIHVELLNAKTPNGTKHRGVLQRNKALDYLAGITTEKLNVSAPVY